MRVLEIPSPGWRSTRWNCCACIFGDCVATLHRGVISPIANEVRTSGVSILSKFPWQSKLQARKVNLTAKFNFDSIIFPRDSFASSGIISIVRCISQSIRLEAVLPTRLWPFLTIQLNLGEDFLAGSYFWKQLWNTASFRRSCCGWPQTVLPKLTSKHESLELKYFRCSCRTSPCVAQHLPPTSWNFEPVVWIRI